MTPSAPPPFTTRPEIRGTFGVAASTHWLASQTAMGVLERGGNAFDAGFAAGMVLQVAEPHMNGPGGDVPILIQATGEDRPRVICGQGPAPKAATIERFKALGLEVIPGTGLMATCIPGAFDAWALMLRDYGTMTIREVLEPAIGYAAKGCPLPFGAVETIKATEAMVREHWPSTAAIYLAGGSVPKTGDLYRNPALAETWTRLLDEAEAAGSDRVAQIDAARACWYDGFVAEEIARFSAEEPHMDATGQKNAGLLTMEDMHGWRAHYEEPVSYTYRGYELFKCGPWSQGPVLLQTMALLEGFDIAAMDPTGPDFVHTVTEAIKLAYADRDTYYGDPDFTQVPLERLLSADYAAERRTLIDAQVASGEFRPGVIAGNNWSIDYEAACRRKPVEGVMAGFGGGEPTAAESKMHASDTCHLDVADRHGNLVSVTPSGGWLQSSPAIPKLGFCLGTRLQMAWLDPAAPSALEPGRRPRTTLTPSLAHKDGRPYMAFGTPGGDQQDQMQIIMLLRHIDHGMNLQQAIDAPAWHSEHFPNSFFPRHASPRKIVAESRFGDAVLGDLRKRGHDVHEGPPWSEGRLSAAAYDDDGTIKGAANPRGMQGYAVGR